jgi:hypothetical protein
VRDAVKTVVWAPGPCRIARSSSRTASAIRSWAGRPSRNSTMAKVDSESARIAGSAIRRAHRRDAVARSAAKARSPR